MKTVLTYLRANCLSQATLKPTKLHTFQWVEEVNPHHYIFMFASHNQFYSFVVGHCRESTKGKSWRLGQEKIFGTLRFDSWTVLLPYKEENSFKT